MCGITGMVRPPRSSRQVSRDLVLRMRDVIRHRGPDAEGLYLDDFAGLGHRRLSIIDVEHGAQPMASDDGRLQLIYNGEVFNHPTLFEELRAAGVTYRTRCDTETILRLYERVGPETPTRLRGMFAIAIWDRDQRELFLARDRFGVKPLYYAALDDGTLLFGSEIKAILASAGCTAAMLRRSDSSYAPYTPPSSLLPGTQAGGFAARGRVRFVVPHRSDSVSSIASRHRSFSLPPSRAPRSLRAPFGRPLRGSPLLLVAAYPPGPALDADQLATLRQRELRRLPPVVVRQVPLALRGVGARLHGLIAGADGEGEAGAEAVRRAHQVAEVQRLRHALGADREIAARQRGPVGRGGTGHGRSTSLRRFRVGNGRRGR